MRWPMPKIIFDCQRIGIGLHAWICDCISIVRGVLGPIREIRMHETAEAASSFRQVVEVTYGIDDIDGSSWPC